MVSCESFGGVANFCAGAQGIEKWGRIGSNATGGVLDIVNQFKVSSIYLSLVMIMLYTSALEAKMLVPHPNTHGDQIPRLGCRLSFHCGYEDYIDEVHLVNSVSFAEMVWVNEATRRTSGLAQVAQSQHHHLDPLRSACLCRCVGLDLTYLTQHFQARVIRGKTARIMCTPLSWEKCFIYKSCLLRTGALSRPTLLQYGGMSADVIFPVQVCPLSLSWIYGAYAARVENPILLLSR